MTRTTDDLQDVERWQPLGSPVKAPAPAEPEWKQKPGAAPGVEVNTKDGRLRTNLPLPK